MDRQKLRQFLSFESPQETKILAVQLRYKNPHLSLQNIADICGVTKQRIHFIFKKYGIPKRPKKPKTLPYCKNCGLISWNGTKYCSEPCHEEYIYVIMPCSQCGQPKKIMRKDVRYKARHLKQYNFFCNRECYHNRRKTRGV